MILKIGPETDFIPRLRHYLPASTGQVHAANKNALKKISCEISNLLL
jgi:hypothetical protein